MFLYSLADPVNLQDPFGLDTVGCDEFMGDDESACQLECCAIHDECYDIYNCGSPSWKDPLSLYHFPFAGCNTMQCIDCNREVAKCIWNCLDDHGSDDPNKKNFYCAKQGRYVDIPGDFPDRPTGEKACQKDHSQDGCPKPGR